MPSTCSRQALDRLSRRLWRAPIPIRVRCGWVRFGSGLGSVWVRFGSGLGPVWVRFGFGSVRFGAFCRLKAERKDIAGFAQPARGRSGARARSRKALAAPTPSGVLHTFIHPSARPKSSRRRAFCRPRLDSDSRVVDHSFYRSRERLALGLVGMKRNRMNWSGRAAKELCTGGERALHGRRKGSERAAKGLCAPAHRRWPAPPCTRPPTAPRRRGPRPAGFRVQGLGFRV